MVNSTRNESFPLLCCTQPIDDLEIKISSVVQKAISWLQEVRGQLKVFSAATQEKIGPIAEAVGRKARAVGDFVSGDMAPKGDPVVGVILGGVADTTLLTRNLLAAVAPAAVIPFAVFALLGGVSLVLGGAYLVFDEAMKVSSAWAKRAWESMSIATGTLMTATAMLLGGAFYAVQWGSILAKAAGTALAAGAAVPPLFFTMLGGVVALNSYKAYVASAFLRELEKQEDKKGWIEKQMEDPHAFALRTGLDAEHDPVLNGNSSVVTIIAHVQEAAGNKRNHALSGVAFGLVAIVALSLIVALGPIGIAIGSSLFVIAALIGFYFDVGKVRELCNKAFSHSNLFPFDRINSTLYIF